MSIDYGLEEIYDRREFDWNTLSIDEQFYKIQRMRSDPLFFLTDPYFQGIRPWTKQEEMFESFYNPETPKKKFVFIGGRRGGKTSTMSFFGIYELAKLLALPNAARHYGFLPGEDIYILCIARGDEQAKDTIFGQISARIMFNPFIRSFIKNPRKQVLTGEIRFPDKNIYVLTLNTSSASGVGRNAKCVLFDELAQFTEGTSYQAGETVFNKISASVKSFRDEGFLFVCSSAMFPGDILETIYKDWDENDEDAICYRYTTWEFNPNHEQADFDDEFRRDPQSAWREYGSRPYRTGYNYFAEQDIIDDSADGDSPNVLELFFTGKPVPDELKQQVYVLGCDPALKNDSFGISLVTLKGMGYKVAGLWRFKPGGLDRVELDPLQVSRSIQEITKFFSIGFAVFDIEMYPELVQTLKNNGVYIETHVVKKEHYDRVKELMYMGRLKYPNYEVIITELKDLLLLRNKVEKPSKGSKDVADAMVNAVWFFEEILMGEDGLEGGIPVAATVSPTYGSL